MKNSLPNISGPWKLMLLGDGSPTRHLQLLTNQETKIKLISMQVDPLFIEEGPKELNQLNGPLVRRQVWIKNNNKNLAWAESWWNAEQVNENLNKIKPKNFGDASKIPGVSKADLTALLVWLKIREIKKEKANIYAKKSYHLKSIPPEL